MATINVTPGEDEREENLGEEEELDAKTMDSIPGPLEEVYRRIRNGKRDAIIAGSIVGGAFLGFGVTDLIEGASLGSMTDDPQKKDIKLSREALETLRMSGETYLESTTTPKVKSAVDELAAQDARNYNEGIEKDQRKKQKEMIEAYRRFGLPEDYIKKDMDDSTDVFEYIEHEDLQTVIEDHLKPMLEVEGDEKERRGLYLLLATLMVSLFTGIVINGYTRRGKKLEERVLSSMQENREASLLEVITHDERLKDLVSAATGGNVEEELIEMEQEFDQRNLVAEGEITSIAQLLKLCSYKSTGKHWDAIMSLIIIDGPLAEVEGVVQLRISAKEFIDLQPEIKKLEDDIAALEEKAKNTPVRKDRMVVLADQGKKEGKLDELNNALLGKKDELLAVFARYQEELKIQVSKELGRLKQQKGEENASYQEEVRKKKGYGNLLAERTADPTQFMDAFAPTAEFSGEQKMTQLENEFKRLATQVEADRARLDALRERNNTIEERVKDLLADANLIESQLRLKEQFEGQKDKILNSIIHAPKKYKDMCTFDTESGEYDIEDKLLKSLGKKLSKTEMSKVSSNLDILNELSQKLRVIEEVENIRSTKEEETREESQVNQRMDAITKELEVLEIQEEEHIRINKLRQAMQGAFEQTMNTVSQMGVIEPEDFYEEFMEYMFEKHPDLLPESVSKIKSMNALVHAFDTNILKEYLRETLTPIIGLAGAYHVFRQLTNMFEYFKSGDHNVLAVGLSLVVGILMHQWMHNLTKGADRYRKDTLGGYSGMLGSALYVGAGTMSFLTLVTLFGTLSDIGGATISGGAGVMKENTAKELQLGANSIIVGLDGIIAAVEDEIDEKLGEAEDDILREGSAEYGGFGPLTSRKLVLSFDRNSSEFEGIAGSTSRQGQITKAQEEIDDAREGQLTKIKEKAMGRLIVAHNVSVEHNGKSYTLATMKLAIEGIGTSLTDVNTAVEQEQLISKFQAAIAGVHDKTKEILADVAREIAEFEADLKDVGGAPIEFSPIDQQEIDGIVSDLDDIFDQMKDIVDENSPFFDIRKDRGKITEIIGNLPTLRALGLSAWILSISIATVWFFVFTMGGLAITQRRKNGKEDDMEQLALKAQGDLQRLVIKIMEIDEISPNSDQGQKLNELFNLDGKGHAVDALLGMKMSAIYTQEEYHELSPRASRKQVKKKMKAHNKLAEAVNTGEQRRKMIQIRNWIITNKEQFDEEAGGFINDKTDGKEELYSDRYLRQRLENVSVDQFRTIAQELFAVSSTMQQRVMEQFQEGRVTADEQYANQLREQENGRMITKLKNSLQRPADDADDATIAQSDTGTDAAVVATPDGDTTDQQPVKIETGDDGLRARRRRRPKRLGGTGS